MTTAHTFTTELVNPTSTANAYAETAIDGEVDRYSRRYIVAAGAEQAVADSLKAAKAHAKARDLENETWERFGALACQAAPARIYADECNQPAGPLSVGQVVKVHAHGRYRQGVVTKIGPKRASIYLTTPGAIDIAAKLGQSRPQTVHKSVPLGGIYV